MKINKDIIIVILILLMGLLTYALFSSYETKRELDNLLEASSADLKVWRDKDGKSTAKIEQLTTQNTSTFLKLNSKDSTINRLQSVVEEYKNKLKGSGSATVVDTGTNIDNKGQTTVNARDTVYLDNKIYIYPEYINDFNLDNWVTGSIKANRDTTEININIKDSYKVVLGSERSSLFGKRKPFALVTSENPYTEIKDLKSYQVSLPRPKRWSVGPSVTFGYDGKLDPHFIVGLSIQYSILRF